MSLRAPRHRQCDFVLSSPPTLSINTRLRVCVNVIAVLSGERKQTGSRREGKDRRGVREHTDTQSFNKTQSGGAGGGQSLFGNMALNSAAVAFDANAEHGSTYKRKTV